ncbi:hypothetical protein [Thermogemmatispora sp.]|uniref:hypothetical protein n=1 Tax=Thermogemmatispora sp. TaxID=1968838 RepID=UPI0035E3FFE1
MRRSVYEAIGGYAHPELRGSAIDDRDLAVVVKRHGYRLRLYDGRGLVRVQLYCGLPALWRGWRKTIFVGSGGLPFMLAALMGLPLVAVLPFLLPLLLWLARGWWRQHGISAGEALLTSLLTLLPLLVCRCSLNQAPGLPCRQTLTHPLAGLLFMGILAEACWRQLTGQGVDWRGRVYGSSRPASAGPGQPQPALGPTGAERALPTLALTDPRRPASPDAGQRWLPACGHGCRASGR